MRGRIFPFSYIKQPLTQLRMVDVTNNITHGSFGRIQKKWFINIALWTVFYLIIYFPPVPSRCVRVHPPAWISLFPSHTPLGGTMQSTLRDQERPFAAACTAQGWAQCLPHRGGLWAHEKQTQHAEGPATIFKVLFLNDAVLCNQHPAPGTLHGL